MRLRVVKRKRVSNPVKLKGLALILFCLTSRTHVRWSSDYGFGLFRLKRSVKLTPMPIL